MPLAGGRAPVVGSAWLPLLCFAIALVEGFDLQAAGVAAPGLARSLLLSPSMLGVFFSASVVGLMIGAVAGGRLADRFGRKQVVTAGVTLFGLASIATALAGDYPALVLCRLLTGVGIGGVMPAIIALTAETEGATMRGTAIARLYAGFPLGGALAALVAVAGPGASWRWIFVVGGVAPLLLCPALLATAFLPAPDRGVATDQAASFGRVFAEGRLRLSIALWVAFFLSLLLMYLLMNWLPRLLSLAGVSAALAGWTQVALNIGGAAGGFALAAALARWDRTRVILATYGCLLLGVPLLARVGEPALLLLAAPIGAALNAAQALLYGIAPMIYPAGVRASGVGIGVTVGRLGAVVGPLLAAQLLTAGIGVDGVLFATFPVAIAAGLSAILLSRALYRRAAAISA